MPARREAINIRVSVRKAESCRARVDEIGTYEPHCPGEEEGKMDFAGMGLTDEEKRIFNAVFADIAEFFPPQKRR